MQSKLIKQFCSFKPHALRPRCPKLGVTLSTKVAHTELFVPQNFARYYNSRVLKSNIRKCNFTSSEGSCTAKPFVGRLILPSSASFHHVLRTSESVWLSQRFHQNKVTPVIEQYMKLKEKHPGFLLMFRIGDFYEMFFEDAVKASKLTKRTRGIQGEEIPMAGVPSHAVDRYLTELIKQGILVAVCDQIEETAEIKGKRLMQRQITRLVTPGTILEDKFLNPRKHNYLVSVIRGQQDRSQFALSWIDLSTGEFQISSTTKENLYADLTRLSPSELLMSNELANDETLRDLWKEYHVTHQSTEPLQTAQQRFKTIYKVTKLDSLGKFTPLEIQAGNVILKYVEFTQIDKMPHLSSPALSARDSRMLIDASTRRALELVDTSSGDKKRSLLSIIDRTITGPGARMLSSYLNSPLTDLKLINQRLDILQFFLSQKKITDEIRETLQECHDIERSMQRLYLARGGPRDLSSIGYTLELIAKVKATLKGCKSPPDLLAQYIEKLQPHEKLVATLKSALKQDPPQSTIDGGFIEDGYSTKLDSLRALRDDSQKVLAELQSKYRNNTSISNLKIKRNNIVGIFVEVPTTIKDKLGDEFRLIQSNPQVARFTTPELKELDVKINTAAQKAIEVEAQIFEELSQLVCRHGPTISEAAVALAGLDVATALAVLAKERKYVRPQLTNGFEFHIKGGRHPTVEESVIETGSNNFIQNDCDLSDNRFWIITGPNMGGKSTFLRQNAIVPILAQLGSFVPADHARLGIVDAIFTRVGASDDITKDRSTFMVEMLETAHIVKNASEKSLVIMDEVGRGTSTWDGLAVSCTWAVVEHLYHHNRSRTLFATHYHELTELRHKLEKLACRSLSVKEIEGRLVFVYKVVDGASSKSYGINVAELAGIPKKITHRATAILNMLLEKDQNGKLEDGQMSEIVQSLQAINPERLSAKDALELVYSLKALASEPKLTSPPTITTKESTPSKGKKESSATEVSKSVAEEKKDSAPKKKVGSKQGSTVDYFTEEDMSSVPTSTKNKKKK